MQLKVKITLCAIALSAIPVLVVSFLIARVAMSESHDALEASARERLISIRDIREQQIVTYFGTINKQIQNMSRANDAIEAMASFAKVASDKYMIQKTRIPIAQMRAELTQYYRQSFSNEYQTRNSGQRIDVTPLHGSLDDVAVTMQYHYIQNNPHPVGQKDALIDPKNNTRYGKTHAYFHPYFRDFQQRFGYYDIFLADIHSGRIVYSVFKELDYGTSLINGPYARSGIGEAFRRASKMSIDETALTDFGPYVPSYEDPASFIASPIFADGVKIGVLIFQMPIDDINAVMTQNEQWKEGGLGNSGETYLVGADHTMRSISRFLIEDKANYLQAIQGKIPEGTVNLIDSKNTTIGLHKIETKGSKTALEGTTGFDIFPDYRDVPVLSAYMPVSVGGLQWALLAEIDQDEAFLSAGHLKSRLLRLTLVITALLITCAIFIAIFFANRLSRRILSLSNAIQHIEQSQDLTEQVAITSNDELGQTGSAFNSMVKNFHESIHHVMLAVERLSGTAHQTAVVAEQTHASTQQQQDMSFGIANAVEQLNTTVNDVAGSSAVTSRSAAEANKEAEEGQAAMQRTNNEIHELAAGLVSTAELIETLKNKSDDIGAVVDVIQSIAEQTNLLALNAAIEAARAGEQGRGFAVVADEVRSLASRTQQSTEEIKHMIDNVQEASQHAVNATHESGEKIKLAIAQADTTVNVLSSITKTMRYISKTSADVADTTVKQTTVTNEISQNISQMRDISEQTSSSAKQNADAGAELSDLAQSLRTLVSRFKTH